MLIPKQEIDAIIASSADRDQRVFRILCRGMHLWVKRGSKDHVNRLQRAFGRFAGSGRMGPARARLYREVTRIRALRRAGALVPCIACIGQDYVVLGDMGISVDAMVRAAPHSGEARAAIAGAAQAIARLHACRQWHGNAKLRNFTQSPAGTGMIDFEDPTGLMPHFFRQVKDLFLLCGSSFRFDRAGSNARLILDSYRGEHTLAPAMLAAILLLPLYVLLYPVRNHCGRDIRELHATLGALYRLAVKG